MKIARFTQGGVTRLGLVDGDSVVDLAAASPSLPRTMIALLEAGEDVLAEARRALAAPGFRLPLAEVRLEAPIAKPPKFLAVGLNYADHIAETGRSAPEFPVFFNKQTTCIAGPFDDIVRPRVSADLDYEGEFAFVIGKRCRHVAAADAPGVVAGYLCANDVSVRDWQFRAPTMTLGKSFDTHGPIGPWLTTPDEIADPHALELKTWVNGDLRQHSNTRNLIFNCWSIIETLSTVFTLEPGDIVSTGTPSGVGMPDKRWLVPGDVVRIEIEGLGAIENRVVDEG